jgi:putative membrane protein
MCGIAWNMGWGFGFYWIWLLIIIVAIFWVIKSIFNNKQNHYSNIYEDNSALEILKKKYARGEYDQKEFEKRKSDILN